MDGFDYYMILIMMIPNEMVAPTQTDNSNPNGNGIECLWVLREAG